MRGSEITPGYNKANDPRQAASQKLPARLFPTMLKAHNKQTLARRFSSKYINVRDAD